MPIEASAVRIAGDGLGLRRLLLETDHPAVGVDLHDAELAGRRLHADRQRADGQVGAAFDVAIDQLGVVHLVDVVAGQDDDVLWAALSRSCRCSDRRRRPCPDTSARRCAAGAARPR